jgi:murein DD-endopeptidase MepM/ murein hydrolase activator NlpD
VATASRAGRFFIGFDRDASSTALLAVSRNGETLEHRIAVSPGDFDIQRIDGLPTDQVSPQDPALLARIGEEAKRKAVGFSSLDDDDGFHYGFLPPLPAWRLSGRFGGQRILNGQPNRPHYGADLAAPVGTPVHAPAPGLVSFAETGLHFEGGLILIDHGQGVVSAYLHLSRIDVRAGEHVRPGRVIGAVGQEGRATGPHLCWRLKWRGRNLDPMLLLRNVPL